MLFTDVQNLVDIVSNLRGTFDFRRPWPIKAMPVAGGGWWVVLLSLVVLSGAVSRTKGRRFFVLVSTFLPSRHDVLRNSTAAAVSCVLKF